MGSRGPIPDPTSERSKTGRNTRTRSRPAAAEPAEIAAPDYVLAVPRAADFWRRIAPVLIADGRLVPEQVDAFGQLARLHADILQLQDQVATEGWITASEKGQAASPVARLLRDSRRDFVTLARDFGLTAAAAARIPQEPSSGEEDDTDEEAAVLKKLSIRNG